MSRRAESNPKTRDSSQRISQSGQASLILALQISMRRGRSQWRLLTRSISWANYWTIDTQVWVILQTSSLRATYIVLSQDLTREPSPPWTCQLESRISWTTKAHHRVLFPLIQLRIATSKSIMWSGFKLWIRGMWGLILKSTHQIEVHLDTTLTRDKETIHQCPSLTTMASLTQSNT